MSVETSRQGTGRADPQMPTMVGARVVAFAAGLLLALTGGVLAATLSPVDPGRVVVVVQQGPV